MTSLQLSILIGALGVVLAVVVFNAWQARRRRSQGEKTLEVLREAISRRVPGRQRASPADPSRHPGPADDASVPNGPGDDATRQARSGDEATRQARLAPEASRQARSADEAPPHILPGDATAQEGSNAAAPDTGFADDIRLAGLAGAVAHPDPRDAAGAAHRRHYPIDSGAALQAHAFADAAHSTGGTEAGGRSPQDGFVVGQGSGYRDAAPSRMLPEEAVADAPQVGSVSFSGQASASASDAPRGSAPSPGSRLPGEIHPAIDLVVGLESWQAWRGERILQALQAMRRIGNRPVLAEGQISGGSHTDWHGLQGNARYARIRLGLPLANRSGALRPTEYADFIAALHQLREVLAASWVDGTEPGDMHTVLERARRLDGACAALDAQVVINLAMPEILSSSAFAQMGARLGLADRGSTRQARLAADGEEIFSMTLGSRPEWATFLLDVPRARVEDRPWQQMIDCAIAAAGTFGGQLLDDAGQPLSGHQLSMIAEQVQARQQQLTDAGYPPGSAIALRVFQ